MRILVTYDSYFGCTKTVAELIQSTISNYHDTEIKHVKDVDLDQLYDYEMVFVGSPTRGFTATKEIKKFIKDIRNLKEFKIGLFDTRIPEQFVPRFVRFLMRKFGYANDTLAKLVYHSDSLLLDPQLLVYVQKENQPENYHLIPGQEEAVKQWAKQFVNVKQAKSEAIPEVDIIPEKAIIHVHELQDMTMVELKKLAKERHIKNYSKMKKTALIEALKKGS